jgi:hypothetical protein
VHQVDAADSVADGVKDPLVQGDLLRALGPRQVGQAAGVSLARQTIDAICRELLVDEGMHELRSDP